MTYRWFVSAVVLACVAALSLPSAHAQFFGDVGGEVRGEYGAWKLRCDTIPGARDEQCAITQYVTAADRENVGLSVVFLRTADKQAELLRVLAPLGVYLTTGLGLRIDSEEIGQVAFQRCLPNGCFVEVSLDETLLAKFRAGSEALFIINEIPTEGIGIPISLEGFSAGFDALP